MYKVVLNNGGVETVIHYQSNPEAPHVFENHLKIVENQSSILTFKINVTNVGYDKITDLVTQVNVVDTRDGRMVFEGRILSSTVVMDDGGKFYKDVTCESELGYFNDSRVGRWEVHPGALPPDAPSYAEPNHTVRTVMAKIINNHNDNVDPHKRFAIGTIEVNDGVYFATNYESTLDTIINKIINDNKLVIKIRKVDSTRYIDILKDNPRVNKTEISLRKNIKSFKITPNHSTFCTRLLAIGADGLTFASINNGKNYVEDTNAIAKYGIITKPFEWQNVTLPEHLLIKATAKLKTILTESYDAVEVTALDLSYIGLTPEQFEVGTKNMVSNDVQGVRGLLKVIQMDLDLSEPWNSSLIFSNISVTATSTAVGTQQQISNNRVEVLSYNDRLLQKVTNVANKIGAFDDTIGSKLSSEDVKILISKYSTLTHMANIPAVQNGITTAITLPIDFTNKEIGTDFTVFATCTNYNKASTPMGTDVIRKIFVDVISWDKISRELKVKPCMQTVDLTTKALYGWDANTTTTGNDIGKGTIDIVVIANL